MGQEESDAISGLGLVDTAITSAANPMYQNTDQSQHFMEIMKQLVESNIKMAEAIQAQLAKDTKHREHYLQKIEALNSIDYQPDLISEQNAEEICRILPKKEAKILMSKRDELKRHIATDSEQEGSNAALRKLHSIDKVISVNKLRLDSANVPNKSVMIMTVSGISTMVPGIVLGNVLSPAFAANKPLIIPVISAGLLFVVGGSILYVGLNLKEKMQIRKTACDNIREACQDSHMKIPMQRSTVGPLSSNVSLDSNPASVAGQVATGGRFPLR